MEGETMTINWTDDEYLRLSCEDDEAAEYAAEKKYRCEWCGKEGDAEFFENHDHGPSPFEDSDDIKAYWAGRSGSGFFLE